MPTHSPPTGILRWALVALTATASGCGTPSPNVEDASALPPMPDAARPLDAEVGADQEVRDGSAPDVGTDDGPGYDAGGSTDGQADIQPDAIPDAAPDSASAPIPDIGPDAITNMGPERVPILLQNSPTFGRCGDSGQVRPILPDEAGHWALERLSPVQTETTIHGIGYQLVGDNPEGEGRCRTELPHRVFVFTAPAGPPPANPSNQRNYRVFDSAVPAGRRRTAEVMLDPPIDLHDGEEAFIAVEMAADIEADISLCMAGCRLPEPLADRSYWGSDTVEPFPWGDIVAEFDLVTNYSIRAFGLAAP